MSFLSRMLPLLTLMLIGNERGFLGTARASTNNACHCLSENLAEDTESSCTSAFMKDDNTCEKEASYECKNLLKVLEHEVEVSDEYVDISTEFKLEPLAIVSVTYDTGTDKNTIGYDNLEFIWTIPHKDSQKKLLILWFRHPRTGKLYHLKNEVLDFQPEFLFLQQETHVIAASSDKAKKYSLTVNVNPNRDFRNKDSELDSEIKHFSTEVQITESDASYNIIHDGRSLKGMAVLQTNEYVYLLDNNMLHTDSSFDFSSAPKIAPRSILDLSDVKFGIQSFICDHKDHFLAYVGTTTNNNIVIWSQKTDDKFLETTLESDFAVNELSKGHQISSVVISKDGAYIHIYIGLRRTSKQYEISSDILIMRYSCADQDNSLTLVGSVRNPMTEMSYEKKDIGVAGLTLSPDGKKLFAASYTKDATEVRFGSIVQWDVDTQTGALYNGNLVQCGSQVLKKPIDLTISSDGRFLSGIDEDNGSIFSLQLMSRLVRDYSDQELVTELLTRQGSCT